MRFLTQRITGVQRFAYEITKELDKLLASCSEIKIIGLLPNAPIYSEYDLANYQNIKLKKCGKLTGHLWEQIELPWYSRDNPLINLCNSSPILKSNKYLVLHDAIFMTKLDSQKWWFKLWYRLQMVSNKLSCKKWYTVSHFSQVEIVRLLSVNLDKIEVLGNAPSLSSCKSPTNSSKISNTLEGKRFFLMIGSNSRRKNTELVAREFADNPLLSEINLVIVGGVFSNLGDVWIPCADNIIQLGYVADSELVNLYQKALGLIFPSLYEGFGIPVVEAMGLGCPVIVSDIPVMHEICGESGLYFNPENADGLVNHLLQLQTDTYYSSQTKQVIQQSYNYSWAKFAKIMLDSIIMSEKTNESSNSS